MTLYLLALFIGIVAGLRAMTAPAAVSWALCGATIGAGGGMLVGGGILGTAGAAIGTLGGAAVRARLAAILGRNLPAAVIEDLVAVIGAAVIVLSLA